MEELTVTHSIGFLSHSNLLINGSPGDLELNEDHLQVPQQESVRSVDNIIIAIVLVAL